MRRTLYLVLSVLLIHALPLHAKQNASGSISISLVDSRKVVYRDINKVLMLRVMKNNMGWEVRVTQNPVTPTSSWNLLFLSLKRHGPHESDVYAWHVGARQFGDERELKVRGYPYKVTIELVNPVAEGEGYNRKFVSGSLRVSWEREV